MRVEHGDCLEVMMDLILEGVQVDSVVTDPPYHLTSTVKRFGKPGSAPAKSNGATGVYKRASAGFMGKQWDGGNIAANPETWSLAYELLKPGGYLLAFGGTRTYHRMVCAIEDAGFEIRDQMAWMYGSGFPKSQNVSIAIDKQAGAIGHRSRSFNMKGGGDRSGEFESNGREFLPPHQGVTDAARQWEGWGTALKPAWEPICVARKPLIGTVAENVLQYGTGAINIDGCRVETDVPRPARSNDESRSGLTGTGGAVTYGSYAVRGSVAVGETTQGRWPANVIHDGSDEVLEAFAAFGESKPKAARTGKRGGTAWHGQEGMGSPDKEGTWPADPGGSPSRFFYAAKASKKDRAGSKHPTVKPIALMRYLCRLVTPPGGTVLDPFAGSGTTLQAAREEGFRAIGIEREAEYLADIKRRLGLDEEAEALLA